MLSIFSSEKKGIINRKYSFEIKYLGFNETIKIYEIVREQSKHFELRVNTHKNAD